MVPPFSFDGRIGRLPYILWSAGAFLSQFVVTVLALHARGVQPLMLDWRFFLMPLQSLGRDNAVPDGMLVFALGWLLVVAWALAALALRRAADAGINGWIATFAMVPVIQIPTILGLVLLPSRPAAATPPTFDDRGSTPWAAAAQGLVVGIGLTLLAVAVGTLVFRIYGYGIFVVSPFLIGALTAYFANRTADTGGATTAKLVASATALGGIALVAASLEGLICIVMAAPLAIGVALVGGLLGRAIALYPRRSPRQTISGLALLPLAFAVEYALPTATQFDTHATIEVRAPAEVVWKSLLRMDLSDEPVGLPFRLGVAYPLRGEVIGEGVGATRRGEFSTGIAVERVTEWVPNRKLAFTLLNDVPAMHELSPYAHVHAPHVVGYFHTSVTSFELVPRPDGGTDIVERTSHALSLEPVLYWLPLARWVVRENNARVLRHIKQDAEARAASAGG